MDIDLILAEVRKHYDTSATQPESLAFNAEGFDRQAPLRYRVPSESTLAKQSFYPLPPASTRSRESVEMPDLHQENQPR